jgi:hypothetical protein
MKGIIFTILEDYLVDHHGREKYDKILSGCRLSTDEPFVGPGTYSDSDFIEILKAASAEIGMPVNEILRDYGKYTFHKLAEAFPSFVQDHHDPKEFLKTVDGIIHLEVNKLYEGAETPHFTYSDPSPDRLIITYQSPRKLYTLMEGLIEGVSAHFEVPIYQSQKIYELDGEEVCDFDLTFVRKTQNTQ